MINIGDMVEVIEGGAYHDVGDIFMVRYMDNVCFLDVDSRAIMKEKVRPLKTKAEKRGAKFGVGGVVKETGKKCVFVSDSLVLPGWWEILVEGETKTWHRMSSQIRLDHEPEYKEIPFSEATHEQRMGKGCVNWLGHTVDEIVRFKNGTYAWSFSGNSAVMVQTDYLTVRIPT